MNHGTSDHFFDGADGLRLYCRIYAPPA